MQRTQYSRAQSKELADAQADKKEIKAREKALEDRDRNVRDADLADDDVAVPPKGQRDLVSGRSRDGS